MLVGYIALEIYTIGDALQAQLLQAYDTALVLLIAWFLHRLISGGEQELLQQRYGDKGSTDKATVIAVAKLL